MEIQVDLASIEKLAVVIHRMADELVKLKPFALKVDLVARDARHIEQIVDQPSELPDLALDDRLSPTSLLAACNSVLQNIETVGNGSEWIAQLVREDGHKLILALIDLLQISFAFPERVLGGGAQSLLLHRIQSGRQVLR